MLKIAKERLNELYAKINESMGLYIPVKKAGEVNYDIWGEGKEVSLETLKTVKSPKNMFFPQSENMMKFKTEGKNLSVESMNLEKRPFVLFGVKACDYKAIKVLDKVFLADPVDTFYQSSSILFSIDSRYPQGQQGIPYPKPRSPYSRKLSRQRARKVPFQNSYFLRKGFYLPV